MKFKGGKQQPEKSIEVKLICHIARNGSFLAGLFRPIRREFECSFSEQPYVSWEDPRSSHIDLLRFGICHALRFVGTYHQSIVYNSSFVMYMS